jgi:GNAT superfamily N-acetyltransferase
MLIIYIEIAHNPHPNYLRNCFTQLQTQKISKMSTNASSIHPVTSEDLPTLIQFLHESKLALTINRLLWKDWPNDICQRPQYINAIESSFKSESCEVFKAVDESGAIVGHLVLTLRQPATSEVKAAVEKGDGKPKIPNGINEVVLAEVAKFAAEVETLKDVEHLGDFFPPTYLGRFAKFCIELTHIFVKHSHRRRGIGSQFVKLATEKAEKAGIPLSLGSEPQAHEFFLAQGFKDTKHVDISFPALLRWWDRPPGQLSFSLFHACYIKSYSSTNLRLHRGVTTWR